MKKLLAILLALVIVLGLCACGGGSDKGGASSGDELTEDGRVKLTVGITSNARVLSYDDNALTDWVEEQCGVELEFVEYAGGTDVDTQISTTIAARQELPDILFGISLNENTLRRYGRDGYLLDLTPYYEDKEGASKTFWTRLQAELGEQEQENVIRKITDPDTGKIFGVPSIQTSLVDGMNYQTWINTEWLDKVGMEAPTDWDSLVKVLKAFAETDCNGNGIDDEIPLFGSSQAGLGGYILDWIINMEIYYDHDIPYVVDENNKLVHVATTDAYREGLKKINYLREEGLLTSLAFTASGNEMKQITTPSSGTALCGIFVGHLTVHTVQGNEVLYQYKPFQTWGCAVRRDNSCSLQNYVTGDCDESKRDKAFEVLMTLWTEEGSYRIRYGQKGVHWDDPDEGATSAIGLPARLKIINDPLTQQNTALWSGAKGTLLIHAEAESAQTAEALDAWTVARLNLHAESNTLFEEAAAKNNPEVICPALVLTEAEKEETEMERTNTSNRISKARIEFCSGTLDINDDKVWDAYLKGLEDMGLSKVMEQNQVAYERQ